MHHIKRTIPFVVLALMLLAGPLSAAQPQAAAGPVNLNKATVEELSALPFIGPKRAALIVQRRQNQPFKSVDELTEIKGIGEKSLEKIRPHVAVSYSARK